MIGCRLLYGPGKQYVAPRLVIAPLKMTVEHVLVCLLRNPACIDVQSFVMIGCANPPLMVGMKRLGSPCTRGQDVLAWEPQIVPVQQMLVGRAPMGPSVTSPVKGLS